MVRAAADEIGETVTDSSGEEGFLQTYHGPFDMANLRGASFRDVRFRNVDFRGADNLRECDLAGASGLETGAFDSEADRAWALRSSGRT